MTTPVFYAMIMWRKVVFVSSLGAALVKNDEHPSPYITWDYNLSPLDMLLKSRENFNIIYREVMITTCWSIWCIWCTRNKIIFYNVVEAWTSGKLILSMNLGWFVSKPILQRAASLVLGEIASVNISLFLLGLEAL